MHLMQVSIRRPSPSEWQFFLHLLYPYMLILTLFNVAGMPEVSAIGRPFVGPFGLGVYPLVLLGLLLLMFWFIAREDVRSHRVFPEVSSAQYFIAAGTVVLAEIFSLTVTHPYPSLSGRMYSFMDTYPAIGGPFMGAVLYIVMLLPFVPALACFLPLAFMRRHLGALSFGLILFIGFLFSEVLNAYYYFLTGPWIVSSVKAALSLFAPASPFQTGRWVLEFHDFRVLLGYSCTEFSSFLLFAGIFGFCWWRRRPKGLIRNSAILALFVLGMMILWFLNLFRIVSIMMVGSRYPAFAIHLFHSAIGPALFFAFFIVYIRSALRFIRA